jgi:hypothetical protein
LAHVLASPCLGRKPKARFATFTHMEVNIITTIVWAIMKCITISLEDENDDFNKEIF